MLYNLYMLTHDAWNLCFWTFLSIPVAVVMIVMAFGHSHNQKKRQKNFEEELEKKLHPEQSETAGQA